MGKGFKEGLRTQLHGYKLNEVTYSGEKYILCTGKVDFASVENKRIASIGTGREVILLDTESIVMHKLYEQFTASIARYPNASLRQVFALAMAFSNAKIKNTEFEWKYQNKEDIKIGQEDYKMPIFTMDNIVAQGKGVCRHHALFTGFLLGEYVKHNKILDTSVHHCRDSWESPKDQTKIVAHTWIVYRQNNALYLIDSMWQEQYNLTDFADYKKACDSYTKEVIDRTLSRASIRPPTKHLPATPIIDADSLNSPDGQLKKELDKLEHADVNLILQLIKAGANVNIQGKKTGWTAAHVAVKLNNFELINALVAKKADLNLKSSSNGRSPLFYVKSLTMLDPLIQGGANLFQKESVEDKTALQDLMERGIISAEDLLKNEIDKMETADPALIKGLINAGVSVDTQGPHTGWTAAHVAAAKDDSQLIAFLATNKADFNLRSKVRGRSPLFYAKTTEMIDRLTQKGADLLQQDNNKKTALNSLAEQKTVMLETVLKKELDKQEDANIPLIKELIESGVPVDTKGTKTEWTAAHIAAKKNDVSLVNFLVAKKANFNFKSCGWRNSPLCYAQSTAMAQVLINNGANYLLHNRQKNPAYRVLLEKLSPPDVTTLKKLLFDKEVQRRDPNQQLLQYCAYTDELKFLTQLASFIQAEAIRLRDIEKHVKGVGDKVALYENLSAEIHHALQSNTVSNDQIKNLIYQAAILSHHRRYGTTNKTMAALTFGVYKVEANSWKSYKNFVDTQSKAVPALSEILKESLNARKHDLPCIVNNEEVTKYEQYRQTFPKT